MSQLNVVDLNVDMGESFGRWTLGDDASLMPHISSANIACGFHAGDPGAMRSTVAAAVEHGLQIGAHVALADWRPSSPRRVAGLLTSSPMVCCMRCARGTAS